MVVRCSLTPLLGLSPRSASDISTLLHFVKKSRSDLVKEKEKLGLFYDWTPWRRSFIQIHYCAVILVAQVLSCCLYLGALWTVVVCVLAGFICRFRLFSHHPELSVSPLFCVCMPVFLSLCSIGPWGGSHSHLLIVTLTWWSHHRALFNRAAELESMLDHWMAIVSVTVAHAEGELIMSRLCSFSAQEPRRALEGPFLKNSEETVWETDPCTGTSGDH